MPAGAKKQNQVPMQDTRDTFTGRSVRVRKARRAMGKGGTPDPNSDRRGSANSGEV